DLQQDVAALRDEADRPGGQRHRGELQLGSAVEEAEAVRTHERRAGGPDALGERTLARCALLAELGEPCSHRDQRPRTRRARAPPPPPPRASPRPPFLARPPAR